MHSMPVIAGLGYSETWLIKWNGATLISLDTRLASNTLRLLYLAPRLGSWDDAQLGNSTVDAALFGLAH